MIVIPPQDPNDRPPDPAAEALGKVYEQFTNVQNLGEFHAALRKRDALYELQHQEMSEKPQDFEPLHPRDFYRQFDRRADEDDKTVVSEASYRIREQLREVLWAERETAQKRALETYKQQFIGYHLAQVDRDRLYYFGKIADAANNQDRERYLTALIGRLKLSGDLGLLYKEDADRLIENIPSDYDIFRFNREFANDPSHAQRLLLYGAYPNIRRELRDELVRTASVNDTQEREVNSETNKVAKAPSNISMPLSEPETLQNFQPAEGQAKNLTSAGTDNKLGQRVEGDTMTGKPSRAPAGQRNKTDAEKYQHRGYNPEAPPGVDLGANAREAAKHALNPLWFENQVTDNGPWDYKKTHGQKFTDFGNWHYGFVGAAAGFPVGVLLREAGINEADKHPIKPAEKSTRGTPAYDKYFPFGGTPPYGDNERAQEFIRRGYEYFQNNRGNFE